jgi:hypothetical protein
MKGTPYRPPPARQSDRWFIELLNGFGLALIETGFAAYTYDVW